MRPELKNVFQIWPLNKKVWPPLVYLVDSTNQVPHIFTYFSIFKLRTLLSSVPAIENYYILYWYSFFCKGLFGINSFASTIYIPVTCILKVSQSLEHTVHGWKTGIDCVSLQKCRVALLFFLSQWWYCRVGAIKVKRV